MDRTRDGRKYDLSPALSTLTSPTPARDDRREWIRYEGATCSWCSPVEWIVSGNRDNPRMRSTADCEVRVDPK